MSFHGGLLGTLAATILVTRRRGWNFWAEAEYTYTPVIGYVVTGSLHQKDKVYLRPRLAKEVCREKSGPKICALS
jgi:hypothetical protein